MINYRTRRNQVNSFIRRAKLPLKTRAEKERFHEAMRSACMVGACEERSRILKLLNTSVTLKNMQEQIIAVPVLQVLGYEKDGKDYLEPA